MSEQKQEWMIPPYSTTKLGTIYCCEFQDLLTTLADASASLIVTDPPYGRKWLSLYDNLLYQSGRLLRPLGSLLAILPNYAMPEIFSYSTPSLRFRWMLCMEQREGPWARLCNAKRNIAVTQKIIGWWTVHPWGGADYRQVEDSFRNPAPEKSGHPWQQSERWGEYCLNWLPPGEKCDMMVLDPMLGNGTIGVVCERNGIPWIGCEVDEATAEKAAERCAEV